MNEQPNILQEEDPFALRRAGKLQKAILTTDFTPTKPNFVKKPSLGSRIWNGLKHGLYTAATAVSAVAVNGLSYAATWLFTSSSNAKKVDTELDTTRIPGTKNEHFKDFDPDALPGEQPIIDDTRRMPVVFEQPIPEDPNQAPTITFEIDQAKEGDSVGYTVVKDEDGNEEEAMGHGFLRMKYTRKDPLTGIPQRYQVCFGFYPKGGFLGTNTLVAQIQNGMYVPGQLNNDVNHDVSVGKTFTVNNRQINKVFLAAQRYEKDGYNFIRRNCTTFVRDMAAVAGLNVDDLMVKTDLQSKEVTLGSLGLLFLGMPMSRLGKIQMLSKAGKNDLSYQRYGQKMLNKEDILRLKKRKLNLRMKGYQPGHTAESIRSQEDFHIHSKKYITRLDDPHNTRRNRPTAYYLRATRQELRNLCAAITRYGRKHGIDFTDALENLNDFAAEHLQNIEEHLNQLHPGSRLQEKLPPYHQHRKMFRDTADAINGYLSGMDQLFRETFRSEPKLNVAFQHAVSNMEWLKSEVYSEYASLQPSEILLNLHGNQGREEPEAEGLNPERDAYFALRLLKFGQYTELGTGGVSLRVQPTQLAAGCIIFGSVRETMTKWNRLSELAAKSAGPGLSEEEAKEQTHIAREMDLLRDLAKAQTSFYSGRELTNSDYRLAFCTLPEAEKDWSLGEHAKRPSEFYQAICFEKAFPGMRKELESVLEQYRTSLAADMKILDEKFPNKKDPFLKLKLYQLRNKGMDHVSSKFSEILARRMKDNTVLDQIESAMIEDYTERNPPKQGEDPRRYDAQVRNTVGHTLTRNLLKGYIESMLKASPLLKPREKDPVQEQLQAVMNYRSNQSDAVDKDPAYAPLRRALQGRLALKFREEKSLLREMDEARREYSASILRPPMGIFKDEVQAMHRDAFRRLQEQKQTGKAIAENPEYVQTMAELLMLTGIRSKLQSDTFPPRFAMYRRTMSKRASEAAQSWDLKTYLAKPEAETHLNSLLTGYTEKDGFAPESGELKFLAAVNSWHNAPALPHQEKGQLKRENTQPAAEAVLPPK